ncbi:Xaa-Pro aminopeptidase 2 [Chelonia mydas]|uniref:Xaa-Pro aminopeptidase 2 n=1 Tax=Chelonia mydas TaxID=8469 RepID=M7B966_CHEMY|nr:Xaa-Pro aminopeptidase 2 [Chelonia mydas]
MGWPKQSSSAGSDIRDCTTSPPFLPPTVTDTSAQLNALRQRMQFYNISAYIIPATDAHMDKLVESSYSPVMMTKAVKNAKEQALLRVAHVRDAVAVIQYLLWLEKNVPKGSVDEFSSARYVDKLRREKEHCRGPSFETISASGLNAALAHYRDGTTDITRTVHWGEPTPFQKEAYTRVLMGNIDLARLVFPSETSGRVVEAFARRALWEVGLNYGHGTGHGIGNFLSVHEWPVGFQSNNVPLVKGMFTSIEPGYYQEGEFGIRIEDVALVVEAQTKIQYLNTHYETIRQLVGPELQRQQLEEEYEWLRRNTQPFSRGTLVAASLGTLAITSLVSALLPDRQA